MVRNIICELVLLRVIPSTSLWHCFPSATVVANIVRAVLLMNPNASGSNNDKYHMVTLPAVVIFSSMACKVYRNTKLSAYQEVTSGGRIETHAVESLDASPVFRRQHHSVTDVESWSAIEVTDLVGSIHLKSVYGVGIWAEGYECYASTVTNRAKSLSNAMLGHYILPFSMIHFRTFSTLYCVYKSSYKNRRTSRLRGSLLDLSKARRTPYFNIWYRYGTPANEKGG